MPGGRLPLRIFEPRYLAMVRNCLKQNAGFGVCLIKEGAEVGPTPLIFPFGILIEIIDWDRDDSGLFLIVTQGVRKFRTISTTVDDSGVMIGEVELLPLEQKTAIPARYSELAELLHRALESVGPLLDYTEADFTDAVWVGGRLVELLPMATEYRHELLAIDDPLQRLDALLTFIHAHHD